MSMIRPRSDVVYGISRRLQSATSDGVMHSVTLDRFRKLHLHESAEAEQADLSEHCRELIKI